MTTASSTGSTSSLRGSVIWLVGGPSVGKSRTARAIQRAGGVDDSWILTGDHHLLAVVPADQLVRRDVSVDDEWPGWSVPTSEQGVVGRPHAGSRALRILDGMYRAAVAMAHTGNNVIIEDVIWEPQVAEIAHRALRAVDAFIVRLTCPLEVALAREHARTDRIDGAAAVYAQQPDMVGHVDLEVETTIHDAAYIAQHIIGSLPQREPDEDPGTARRTRGYRD
jgi:chloramphenicol 3-O phosphotransferase